MTDSQVCKVDRGKLTGYRRPTPKEKEGIYRYMLYDGKRTMRAMAVWNVVCAVLAGGTFLGLVTGIGRIPMGEMIMGTVIFLAAATVVFTIRLNRKSIKQLLSQIKDGEYQVMDCQVYETYFSSQMTSVAAVKVYNDHGQYCTFDFTLDLDTAKQCRAEPRTRILLARFSDKRYELISQNRMEFR